VILSAENKKREENFFKNVKNAFLNFFYRKTFVNVCTYGSKLPSGVWGETTTISFL